MLSVQILYKYYVLISYGDLLNILIFIHKLSVEIVFFPQFRRPLW